MAKITICNMIASRRRSASDLFLENGIWILRSYFRDKGHTIEPLDLATNSFYRKISPALLSSVIRRIYAWTFRRKKPEQNSGFLSKIIFRLVIKLQDLNSGIRKKRMRRELSLIADRVAANRDPIFGVKVWYGEAFQWADELSRMIHAKSPSTIVVAGGYHPSLYEKDFMDLSSFDMAVTGEGEQPLEEILAAVDEHSIAWEKEKVMDVLRERIREGKLKNTILREKGEQGKYLHIREHPEIIEKAIPRFEVSPDEKMLVHILVDSLGCGWGKCHFCVHSKFFKDMAPRECRNVVDEIEELNAQGIGLFRFSGSDTYPKFGARIGQEIIDRGLDIRYTIGARATRKARDPEIFETLIRQYEVMIRSGMRSVFMGGETGNDWVNEHVMNKGDRKSTRLNSSHYS